MSTRKKNAVLPRQGKQRISSNGEKAVPYGPPRLPPEIQAMLMVGEEQVFINQEVNDNVCFMTEFIDCV
ncbi:hypothetical protein [Duganella violaceipulchra]|uniref:Uncharacterized protein n=1 Tax=Duganella violaceipulchra TaxID=2849652 RepID=A0AA41H7Z0_9BURK|nr:hypothetical protein [Duganella violaceicalia]MBV6321110.1 hypothetical protein [Duganella violaceicalia]MCP2009645.1 hypothetical protein [Duganella violaceicalia]